MAFKAQSGIGYAHAFAIINNLDKGLPGILYNEFYLGSACIYSIFQQFLYYRGRPLYYLTGSYLVGNVVRKQLDNTRHWEGYCLLLISFKVKDYCVKIKKNYSAFNTQHLLKVYVCIYNQ